MAAATAPAAGLPKDYVPAAGSAHALYQLELDAFSGPLDLLLFLIRRHQIDIFDIPIAFICARYLDALQALEGLNLDVAAEFMLMASELLHIKSRLLLPRPAHAEEAEEEGADPRAELVRRLLAYQRFQEAAAQLEARPRLERDLFARPAGLEGPPCPGPWAPGNIFALTQALHAALNRQRPEARHRVTLEEISLRQRMRAILAHLADLGTIGFARATADAGSRLGVIVSFLSVLELARMGLIHLDPSDPDGLVLAPRFACLVEAQVRVGQLEEGYAGPA